MPLVHIQEHTHRGDALGELQSFKTVPVAGAAADTNIAVAGAKVGDTVQAVMAIDFTGDTVTDETANASFTSDGNLQVTTDTTGKTLLVSYWVQPAHRA